MIPYGHNYKAPDLLVSIYLHCCFHWFEELPKHNPYNRSDKSSPLPTVNTILPHFSKLHISHTIESKTSVPQVTGTSQKTNLGFLTILLLGNSPQPVEVSLFFLSFSCFQLMETSLSTAVCALVFDKVNWRFCQIFLFLMYNFAISKHLWSTSLPQITEINTFSLQRLVLSGTQNFRWFYSSYWLTLYWWEGSSCRHIL